MYVLVAHRIAVQCKLQADRQASRIYPIGPTKGLFYGIGLFNSSLPYSIACPDR